MTAKVNLTLHDFFDLLYGDEEEGNSVICFREVGTKQFVSYWYPREDLKRMISFINSKAKKGCLYYGIALQNFENAYEHKKLIKNRTYINKKYMRGFNHTTEGIPGLWIDMDVKSAAHTDNDNFKTIEEALNALEKFPLQPTLILHTGNGLQAYWLFKEYWKFENNDERAEALWLSKQFTSTLKEFAVQLGGKVDSTGDVARIFRLPSSWNCKDPNNLKAVQFLEYNENVRYNPVDFEEYLLEDDEENVNSQVVSNKENGGKNTKSKRKKSQMLKIQMGAVQNISSVFRGNYLEPIVDGCEWIRHCKADAKTLPEPEWILMLSILILCKRGEKACREWSEPYKGYSKVETIYKAYRALAKGPVTCDVVCSNTGGNYCKTCPHFNKIKSPIRLGAPNKQSK